MILARSASRWLDLGPVRCRAPRPARAGRDRGPRRPRIFVAPELGLHIICDNYSTHKHTKVTAWLKRSEAWNWLESESPQMESVMRSER